MIPSQSTLHKKTVRAVYRAAASTVAVTGTTGAGGGLSGGGSAPAGAGSGGPAGGAAVGPAGRPGAPVSVRSAAGEVDVGNTVSPLPAAGTARHSFAIAVALSRTTATTSHRHQHTSMSRGLHREILALWLLIICVPSGDRTWLHGVCGGCGRAARRARQRQRLRRTQL